MFCTVRWLWPEIWCRQTSRVCINWLRTIVVQIAFNVCERQNLGLGSSILALSCLSRGRAGSKEALQTPPPIQESFCDMNGQFDLITLISLVVAAVAIFKLRSVLGQRNDEDDQRVERLRTREREARAANPEGHSADVIAMPQRYEEQGADEIPAAEPDAAEVEKRIRDFGAEEPVTDGLVEIGRLDPAFDPKAFLNGASIAYEMIVTAFAEGNRKVLKDLLSRDVFDSFDEVIAERERSSERVEQQFVGIKKSEIAQAEVQNGVALVTVRFLSELISVTYDGEGRVTGGDPQEISEVSDVWTFSRDVSTERARRNQNWLLVETQAPN